MNTVPINLQENILKIYLLKGNKSFKGLEFVASTAQPALVGTGPGYKVFHVRWPTIRDLHGEGLLLVPAKPNGADIIAIIAFGILCTADPDVLADIVRTLVLGAAIVVLTIGMAQATSRHIFPGA